MPRFHDTIPDPCNPNLTDEQIAELVAEGIADIEAGRFTTLNGPDEIEAYVLSVMCGDEKGLKQAG